MKNQDDTENLEEMWSSSNYFVVNTFSSVLFYKDLTESKFGLGEMLKSYGIIFHTQARAIQVSKIVFFAVQDAFLKSADPTWTSARY